MTHKSTIYDFVKAKHQDAIIHYASERGKLTKSVAERSELLHDLANMLSFLAKDTMIVEYCKTIAKGCNLDPKEFRREAMRQKEEREQLAIDEDDIPIPVGVNREEFEKHGFYEMSDKRAGYYFWAGGKEKFTQVSNFIIVPQFHIYSKTDNKRLVEINNGKYSSVLDLPSKALVGIQMFREYMYQEGNFRFDGNSMQLNKIIAKISEKFPRCEELKTLGWQGEGFFAFSDGIFNGTWIPVNKHGVVINKEKHFFLPAFSSIYADTREEDDLYENDRWFKFKSSPKNNFENWGKLIMQAYGQQKGMFAVAYLVASLFRDMIYSKYKIFPHLFLFGEKGSGKSQVGWSLSNIFWSGQPGFNLTAGTNVGFFRKLARARNSVTWFDEYNDYIDPKRFQALKSAYDGIGHEKGVMSRDNRTESTKVNSSCVISGQYLPTLDDNALFTRSILLTFRKEDWQGKPDVAFSYSELKQMEESGQSGIIADIIKFRDLMESKYTAVFAEEFTKMKEDIEDYNERILRNFVTIISAVKTLKDVLKFPFSYDDIYKQSKAMIIEQSAQISESEALSQFWLMIEFLYRDRRINYANGSYAETDFKIQMVDSLKIMVNRKEENMHNFTLPTKCLFVRFSKIHPLYMEMHRKQHGHNGIAMSSLKTYIHGHKAFIGLTKATSFNDGVSSAYVFDYNELGINIEQLVPEPIDAAKALGYTPVVEQKELPY